MVLTINPDSSTKVMIPIANIHHVTRSDLIIQVVSNTGIVWNMEHRTLEEMETNENHILEALNNFYSLPDFNQFDLEDFDPDEQL